ncbi:thiol-disulfide isomerase/thioredoxin [Polymorphobacter fuscus]|nr:TlpA disulfide reductase family protein [Polymorphobacter fuscus]NJC09199.1 thiol-disulfide isomerase/thioredoxin [Polymorphobacter fuscus]
MGIETARLLLALGAAASLAACDGGDKGKTAAPQATSAAGSTPGAAAARLNVIDRSQAGTPAPDVPFEWHGGDKTSMADFRGKKVLVNLWATWCAPCIAEMPELDRLAGSRRGKLVILPISQDMEGWLAVNKFFTEGKFNALEPYVDQPGSFAEAVKAKGLPISILYDEQGKEVWRVAGTPNWNELAMQGIV